MLCCVCELSCELIGFLSRCNGYFVVESDCVVFCVRRSFVGKSVNCLPQFLSVVSVVPVSVEVVLPEVSFVFRYGRVYVMVQ